MIFEPIFSYLNTYNERIVVISNLKFPRKALKIDSILLPRWGGRTAVAKHYIRYPLLRPNAPDVKIENSI